MTGRTLAASVLFICLSFPLRSSGAIVPYVDLTTPPTQPLPYGEPIALFGNIKDVKINGETLERWLDLETATASYQSKTKGTIAVPGHVNAKGDFEFILDAFAPTSFVTLDFVFQGKINNSGAEQIVDRIFRNGEFLQKLDMLYSRASGTPQAVAARLAEFTAELKPIIQQSIPQFLAVSEDSIDAMTIAGTPANIMAFTNLQTNIASLKSALSSTGVVIGETSPSAIYGAVQKNEYRAKFGQDPVILAALDNFEKPFVLLRDKLKNNVVARVSAHSTATASAQVTDIQKYAGFDIAAIYSPGIDELREFITANIYFGPVDDKPVTYRASKNWSMLWSRLSLTLGWSIGDLSGNDNSSIKSEHAYIIGLGCRLNKYFRVSIGDMVYRSQASNDLKGQLYYGVSIDLTAFDALSGLVTKKPGN